MTLVLTDFQKHEPSKWKKWTFSHDRPYKWRNKTQEGVCHVIERLICALHFLHPLKPQRPNKTTSSETEVWLWKMSALWSSLWGGYEIKNSSNALIVSLFFPKLTKINIQSCVNIISVHELSWAHLVNAETSPVIYRLHLHCCVQ